MGRISPSSEKPFSSKKAVLSREDQIAHGRGVRRERGTFWPGIRHIMKKCGESYTIFS
jgi:hypothetical protein